MRYPWMVAILLITVLSACRDRAIELLPEDKMAVIMSDMIIADHAIRQYPIGLRDSMQVELMKSLLKIHNLTKDELDTMIYLYSVDYDKYEQLLDNIDARFDSLNQALTITSQDTTKTSTGL